MKVIIVRIKHLNKVLRSYLQGIQQIHFSPFCHDTAMMKRKGVNLQGQLIVNAQREKSGYVSQ